MAAKMGKSTRSRKAGGTTTTYSDAPAVMRGAASKGRAKKGTPMWQSHLGSILGSPSTPAGKRAARKATRKAMTHPKRKAIRKARMKSGAATMARPGAGTKVKIQPRRGGLAAAHGEVLRSAVASRRKPKMKPRNRAKQSAAKQRVLKPSNALAKRFARFL